LTTAAATSLPAARSLPPILGRLLRGSFWLALKTPLQALFAFWSIPLIIESIGQDAFGAYGFAWGFGFIQFLLEFGMSSALQRQVSDCWTRGDRDGVHRAVACGTAFYAAVAAVQAVALVAIAIFAVPHAGYAGDSARLVIRLLLLQALTAPAYGLSTVVASVLQAARRYEFFPRLEVAAVILRFAILYVGLSAGFDFFAIVAAQVLCQVALMLGPASWVMVRELGFRLHIRGAEWGEFRGLLKVSVYVFLIQLSVVLADRIDKTVLGFALPAGVAGPATAIYEVVSKPFFQIRQTGWMLSYLVLPAVASLAAAGDRAGLERVKYDGSRLLIGLLVPVALLACIDAAPFLSLWVGPAYAAQAPLLRLFLVATLPLLISVLVQMSIGLGRLELIALAALGGSLVNLPQSYYLTLRIGMPGVIWGTVLTTLFSNLLIPGLYTFRVLEVRPSTFLKRTLAAPLGGAAMLLVVSWTTRRLGLSPELPPGATRLAQVEALVADLVIGCLAYLAGYLLTASGRSDLATLVGRLRRRKADASRSDMVNGSIPVGDESPGATIPD
jgi:O-antigen/teichoic acid export membrane protein